MFASGPNAGQAANASNIGGNGLLTNIVNFNVRLNSLDNITNDMRIGREFAVGGGTLAFTGGFYASRQDIDTDWLWTSHVQTVRGQRQRGTGRYRQRRRKHRHAKWHRGLQRQLLRQLLPAQL